MKKLFIILLISFFGLISVSSATTDFTNFNNIILNPNQTDGVIPAGVEYYKISVNCDDIYILDSFDNNYEFVILNTLTCNNKEFLLVRLLINQQVHLVNKSDVIVFSGK